MDMIIVEYNSSFMNSSPCAMMPTLRIPCSFLRKWESESCGKLVSLVNRDIQETMMLDETNSDLEERLQLKFRKLCAKVKKMTEKARQDFLKKEVIHFHLKINDIISFSQVFSQVETLQCAVNKLSDSVNEKDSAIEVLKNEVTKQRKLLQTSAAQVNLGKEYDDVQERQKARKLSTIKTTAERALWFVSTFGLSLEKVVLKTPHDERIEISYSDDQSSSSPESSSQPDEHICETLFLLEQFNVSDIFYHELSMLYPQLPRSYKMKACRKEISTQIDLIRLPSPFSGAYRPIRECIGLVLSDKTVDNDKVLQIKFSGDGASFSKSANYVLLSFSFPTLCEDVLAGSGNHTFAAVKISESYDQLKAALEPVFTEMNDLISNETLNINGSVVNVQYLLGSDMKFMLLVMGMNAANSNYACLWCDIHKANRWDMSILPGQQISRTLVEMKECAEKRSPIAMKGCIRAPLIEIEPRNCVPDELHLFLRISDVLLRTFFSELIRMDKKNNVTLSSDGSLLQKSVKKIRSFGINFSVWLISEGSQNSNSRSSFEFTAINRNERLKVLKRLPQSFDELISSEIAPSLAKLWIDFVVVYEMISSAKPDPSVVEKLAKEWVTCFISFSSIMQGHHKSNVTPYMHIMAYHVPDVMRRFGNIRQFSGQGVEKNNDDAKRHYYSGNRHDAARDILISEARIETLQRETPSCIREKRTYVKRRQEYWEHEITENRRAKRMFSETEV